MLESSRAACVNDVSLAFNEAEKINPEPACMKYRSSFT